MSALADGFKFAIRTMKTKPGFSLMVIGMLALGIAGNAAIFSMWRAKPASIRTARR